MARNWQYQALAEPVVVPSATRPAFFQALFPDTLPRSERLSAAQMACFATESISPFPIPTPPVVGNAGGIIQGVGVWGPGGQIVDTAGV